MKRLFLFPLFLHAWLFTFCQDIVFSQSNSIPLGNFNGSMPNAWAGGFNASTFAKFDFDLDGTEDLILFDRQQNRMLPFIAKQNKYTFAPAYADLFPSVKGYALFYDYNKDGKKDLFTSGTLGITLYKNISTATKVTFQLVMDPIPTRYYSNVPINMSITYLDVPSFVDIDNDGDMDILHFNAQTGESALMETNYSMEKYGRPDSLYFGTTNECWGGFKELGCSNYIFGNNCKVNYNYRLEHVGAGGLTVFDADGNGYPDLLVGKSDCQNLNYLQNNASGTTYIFTKRVSYPENTPVTLDFPIGTWEDFDFDGTKDLLVSMGLTEEINSDLRNTAWLYHNASNNSTANFQLSSKNFMQNTMLDMGEKSVPAFADADGDGDQDLFVSTSNGSSKPSTISYFKNIGNASSPDFQLADSNYLSMDAFGYSSLYITFSDLNNDDRLDLVYTAQKGTSFENKVFYNQSVSGLQFSTAATLNIPIDELAPICFYPIDSDSLPDALVGDAEGNLKYYRNTGTSSAPIFTLANDNYGSLSSMQGNCQPSICDIDNNDKVDLLVVTDSGYVKVCDNFLQQTGPSFSYRILSLHPFKALGQNLALAYADLNKDGFNEIVVGNASGGLYLFTYDPILTSADSRGSATVHTQLKVWPNPTDGLFKVEVPENGDLQIFDAAGSTVCVAEAYTSPHYQANKFQSGFYIVILKGQSGKLYQQKVIVR